MLPNELHWSLIRVSGGNYAVLPSLTIPMTPEAIRTVGQIRQEFYQAFAAEIDFPVTITKGNTCSSNPAKVSWCDHHQRPNYICLYAHIAPGHLRPHRPLILRLGLNQGLGLERAKRRLSTALHQSQLMQFHLTLLPQEALLFAPWLAEILNGHQATANWPMSSPQPLSCTTLHQLCRQGAWTQNAIDSYAQEVAPEVVDTKRSH